MTTLHHDKARPFHISGPTSHQLHLLPGVTLGVEGRVAAIPDLTDETGRQGHVVPANQHAGATLISQREGQHLHLLLDWTNEKQGGVV